MSSERERWRKTGRGEEKGEGKEGGRERKQGRNQLTWRRADKEEEDDGVGLGERMVGFSSEILGIRWMEGERASSAPWKAYIFLTLQRPEAVVLNLWDTTPLGGVE